MPKRTQTDSALKNPMNFHPTPSAAATPLVRILPPFTEYDEPCAGDGELIGHLSRGGHRCIVASDIVPRARGIRLQPADQVPRDRMVITNPPFAWSLLQPLLDYWVGHIELWLLLPWDMPCNVRMQPYAVHIDRMLPLGRVSWLRNGQGGYENYGWFHFATEPQGLVLKRESKRITTEL